MIDVWMATTHGFYSVVCHKDDEDLLLIRCRNRSHHQEMVNRLGGREIVEDAWEDETADYRYRIVVHRRYFADLMLDTVEDIDYPSFSTRLAQEQGMMSAAIHKRAWAELLSLSDDKSRYT